MLQSMPSCTAAIYPQQVSFGPVVDDVLTSTSLVLRRYNKDDSQLSPEFAAYYLPARSCPPRSAREFLGEEEADGEEKKALYVLSRGLPCSILQTGVPMVVGVSFVCFLLCH